MFVVNNRIIHNMGNQFIIQLKTQFSEIFIYMDHFFINKSNRNELSILEE